MAIFKRLTCGHCGKVRHVQSEKAKGEPCACGGVATHYSQRWWISTTIGGELIRKPVANTREEARVILAGLVSKAASGESFVRPNGTTLKDALNIFEDWCDDQVAGGNMDWKTRRRYLVALAANVSTVLGHVHISKVDHLEMDRYVKIRRKNGAAPATINREVSATHRLLSVCVRKRLLARNPLDGYPKLAEPQVRDRCLTEAEIARLLDACRSPEAPRYLETMVTLALHTGLRKDGVLGLKWEHIDWKANRITRVVKGGKEVRIPMSQELAATLKRWRSSGALAISGYVFPSPRKPGARMLVTSNIGFDAAVARARLGAFVFHEIRHTFLTHLIMREKDIQLAADIAGHSTIWITQRYTHLLDDHKQRAMKDFGYNKEAVCSTTV